MARRRIILAAITLASALGGLAFSQVPSEKIISGPPSGLTMKQSFRDDFDGPALDRKTWRAAFKTSGAEPESVANRSLFGNRERQLYVEPGLFGMKLQPFTFKDGLLTITAQPMASEVKAAVAKAVAKQPANIANSALRDVAYTSGLISSLGAFSQTYGYFEIRTRWRGGKGLWPAFWMLPTDASWPPEIDVMEALGHESGKTYHSIHTKTAKSTTIPVTGKNDTSQFHTYGVLWTKEKLDYYIDGAKVATIPTPGDANRPMYLLANLAIGGNWPGDPDKTTSFPATMDIDFIRAWAFTNGAGR